MSCMLALVYDLRFKLDPNDLIRTPRWLVHILFSLLLPQRVDDSIIRHESSELNKYTGMCFHLSP